MDKPYVGFWWRVLAALIDSIIIGIVIVIVTAVGGISFSGGAQMGAEPDPAAMGVVYLIVLLVPIAYYGFMQGSGLQATLGKLAIGAIVTDLNGRRMGYGKALLREVCKYPSAVILYIGFLMVAFTARKQGLHDIMAGTLVLKKRLAGAPIEAGA